MGSTKAGCFHPGNDSMSHRFLGGIEGCKWQDWQDRKGCNLHLCRFGKWYHDFTCKKVFNPPETFLSKGSVISGVSAVTLG